MTSDSVTVFGARSGRVEWCGVGVVVHGTVVVIKRWRSGQCVGRVSPAQAAFSDEDVYRWAYHSGLPRQT